MDQVAPALGMYRSILLAGREAACQGAASFVLCSTMSEVWEGGRGAYLSRY